MQVSTFSPASLPASAYISTVMGVRFFEHPRHGDESPLLAVRNGVVYETSFWESPTVEELSDEMIEAQIA